LDISDDTAAVVGVIALLWALVRGVWPVNRRSAGHYRLGQQIEFAPREA
jgi:hypothetical protein